MSTSNILRGTFILTLGTMISRVLGLVYIFPFYALVGTSGGELYTYAYVVYSVVLSIATMGVPLAVSKFVAKYNALEEYAVGRKLFNSGLYLMSLTGIVAFIILYVLAPFFSPMIINEGSTHSYDDVTLVIRMVSFALLLVPVMSLIRGFFQGHESMGPTAVSQVVEQIARIIFLLGSVYIILNMADGSLPTAVGYATFGAFIGALAGLGILIWYWFSRKKHLDTLLEQDRGNLDISYKDMYKELVMYAAPFVFVGLAMPLYQLVDTFSFNKAMALAGVDGLTSGDAFAHINTYGQKLVIIPVTLATAFALSLLPAITKSFVNNEQHVLQRQLSVTFQILLFLTIPACVGLSILGGPAYAAFYSYDELGGYLLAWYAPTAIPLAIFTVTASVLQGINRQKYTVYGLAIGIVLKIVLNYPLIYLMEAEGSIVATAIGYVASVMFNLWAIQKFTDFNYSMVFRRGLLMLIFNAVMIGAVLIVLQLLDGVVLYSEGRMQAIIVVGISAIVGVGVYFALSYRSGLLMYLFGNRFSFLNRKARG
ncbi:putative polysaccharide biosynthesis protein [Sutcliffiella rhizosphaerae]|uniref:Lipid II flippase MurJ n=1 Tax=Sutcliffiella rhizosphaerae TaxID=2880967 RepID=A0ABN8AEH8_9BACI|nr:polysaccharide biosynthesis protein [Sutcliffiella rhizosphaerae]CAG9622152.1 Lipid II flippase MurJ [Sutcliffiella rhizosphaerae]